MDQIVTVKVPPQADHLALLRTAVWAIAARDRFTLDQLDDLRMAVEEAAVQLLRQATGEPLELDAAVRSDGLELRLHTTVSGDGPVIDESSFAAQILKALADEVRVETEGDRAIIILTKRRTVVLDEDGA
jgi:serine/threonine-protein kinase RsbW